MSTTNLDINRLADKLYHAEQGRYTVPPLVQDKPSLQVEESYEIQLYNVARRVQSGDRVVGHKVGLTSKPMQQMLGVGEPDFGHLFASMQYHSGDVIAFPLIQPKVEPELAFVLKHNLEGTNLTVHDVLKATDYVVPAVEIIDSRIADWKIGLVDTVADNASSGCFALGTQANSMHSNRQTVGAVMKINGQVVQTGAGAAVLGDPAIAVAWLANKLNSLGTSLKQGDVILSGAVSAAAPVKPGDHVSVSFGRLGRVDITIGQYK